MNFQNFLIIKWDINPEIFRIGGFALRYYSIMFVLAFILGFLILKRIYIKEGISILLLNKLFLYVFIATVVGARLGHALFYEFDYYRNHPAEIVLPFRVVNGKFEFTGYQGLASHGAALGILSGVALYCKKYGQSFLSTIDKLVIVIALSGFFIRIGNLFNSEIIGKPTLVRWAFIFERVDYIPRHPAQFYEAIGYLIIFIILMTLYNLKPVSIKTGFLFGVFLVLVFSVRFVIEFLKESQEPFENGWPINLGQILSIPFILIGLFFILKRHGKKLNALKFY